MNLGRVCGQVVSTRKSENLMGFKILIVQPISLETFEEKGAPVVSIDTIGAGAGEVVMMVTGSSARQTALTDAKPTDNSIVAIIDSVDIGGRRVFDKADPTVGLPAEEVPTIDGVLGTEPAEIPEQPAEELETAGSEAPPAEEPEAMAVEMPAEEPKKERKDKASAKKKTEDAPAEPEKPPELQLFSEFDGAKARQIAERRARKLVDRPADNKEEL